MQRTRKHPHSWGNGGLSDSEAFDEPIGLSDHLVRFLVLGLAAAYIYFLFG